MEVVDSQPRQHLQPCSGIGGSGIFALLVGRSVAIAWRVTMVKEIRQISDPGARKQNIFY